MFLVTHTDANNEQREQHHHYNNTRFKCYLQIDENYCFIYYLLSLFLEIVVVTFANARTSPSHRITSINFLPLQHHCQWTVPPAILRVVIVRTQLISVQSYYLCCYVL